MALQITRYQAERIVCAAFEGRRPEDEILELALKLCNITHEKFTELKSAMREVSTGQLRAYGVACVLAPLGGKPRSRR